MGPIKSEDPAEQNGHIESDGLMNLMGQTNPMGK